ncbi:MAG: phosphatidate cytidylyltransferase [bacterium]|nr:phosphatidate cytidylyltransferase [bacterium]
MIPNCIFMLLFFFMVAGFAVLYKIRSASIVAVKKKYHWYLWIVTIVSVIIISDQLILKAIFILAIVLKGFFELINLDLNPYQKWRILALYLGVGLLSSFYFVWFNAEIILPIFVFVVIFDGMSQIGGQLFGKHKLTPIISPNKTWEGLGFGFFSAIMAIYVVINYQSSEYFSILHFIGFAFFALMGDLIASKIKRMANVKDFDHLIPGHGGVLDRFDSFITVMLYLMVIMLVDKV